MQEQNHNIDDNSKKIGESLVASKSKKRAKINKRKTRIYYSFLTITLVFCLIQIGFGVILNISKTVAHQAKINTMMKIKVDAEGYNKELKENIDKFSTTKTLESIARNNLKMASEDEVLVLINERDVEEIEESHPVTEFLKKWSMNGKYDSN